MEFSASCLIVVTSLLVGGIMVAEVCPHLGVTVGRTKIDGPEATRADESFPSVGIAGVCLYAGRHFDGELHGSAPSCNRRTRPHSLMDVAVDGFPQRGCRQVFV